MRPFLSSLREWVWRSGRPPPRVGWICRWAGAGAAVGTCGCSAAARAAASRPKTLMHILAPWDLAGRRDSQVSHTKYQCCGYRIRIRIRMDPLQFGNRIRIKVISLIRNRIRIRINLQMTMYGMYGIWAYLSTFWQGLTLYLEARHQGWKVGSGFGSASNKNRNPDPHQDNKLNPDSHPDPLRIHSTAFSAVYR